MAQISNERTGTVLAEHVRLAVNFWTRLKGLLGTTELPEGHGLWIAPCNSVHCLGMKYAIDVLFIGKDATVLKVIPDMAPGRLSPVVKGAKAVLELPAGTLASSGTREGDRLVIPPDMLRRLS